MKTFSSIVSEKLEIYRIITEEQDMAAAAPQPQATPDAPATAPSDNSPTPTQGASQEKPKYDKPYQDLAKILYKALRLDFDDLGTALQQKIMNLQPDTIDTDEQGVAIFKEVEAILNEQQGSEPAESGFGPGANKI